MAALVLPERGRRAAFDAHLALLSYSYKHSEEADEDYEGEESVLGVWVAADDTRLSADVAIDFHRDVLRLEPGQDVFDLDGDADEEDGGAASAQQEHTRQCQCHHIAALRED